MATRIVAKLRSEAPRTLSSEVAAPSTEHLSAGNRVGKDLNLSAKTDLDLSPADRELSPTDLSAPTVLDLFRAAVLRHPKAIALSDSDASLTYLELWNFAAAFRARLAAQGMVPGERVGMACGRSMATVAAIVGVVMAGGCYVPIDLEEFPAATLRELRESRGLHRWIADAKAREQMAAGIEADAPTSTRPMLPLEDVSCPTGCDLEELSSADLDPEAPLYVMFTSGSTGTPKGVVVPHRAVVRLVVGQEFMQFGPGQTFLLHSPLSFDASTLELWGSLLHGSRLIVAPARRLGLDDYVGLVARRGVTTLWLTAAMFHLASEYAPELFAPLTQLIFGGDVIAPRHVEHIRSLYPQLHMVNGYGPTENTTFTCCYVVPEEYRAEGGLPIGFPIRNTTVHILDAEGQPVAPGELGELATGGAGVALGYLGQPEATSERFIPDNFPPGAGRLLYRTGDRVRQRQDGPIEFHGRLDTQVKIAGHRVDPGTIERVLFGSPGVADAVVLAIAPLSGEKHLVAFLALAVALEDAETKLRPWLSERVPRAAVPEHWLFLPQLPINANGKLDRNALRAEYARRLAGPRTSFTLDAQLSESGGNIPGGEVGDRLRGTEGMERLQQLQQLWASLLGRVSVGSEESFFDLGGTSLLLIEMHARLREQFAAVPTLVEMFQFPTPRLLAERLDQGPSGEIESSAGERRGERQRAAMLARRKSVATAKFSASEKLAASIADQGSRR